MKVQNLALLLMLIVVSFGCKNESSVAKDTSSTVQKTEVQNNTKNQDQFPPAGGGMVSKVSAKDIDNMSVDELKEHFKNDPSMLKKIEEREKAGETIGKDVGKKENGISDPCAFVDSKFLASKLGASEGHVKEKRGKLSPGADKTSRSCFWKWNNGGLMIQISTNPMPDELPNYISKSLNAKKAQGDSNLDSESKSKFVDFKGPGTMNIKHQESGRYYVSKGDDYMIMIMFQGKKKNYDKLVSQISSKILNSL